MKLPFDALDYAALSWFLNSWIFMCVTAWVVGILYAREFRSKALRLLTRP